MFLDPLLFLSTAFVLSAAGNLSFQPTTSQPSRPLWDENRLRLRGIRSNNGSDFILGALIPVHRSASGARCGNELTSFGVQRVEEILYLLDRINSDTDLLPNLTLGFDIRDTCLSTNVALGESLGIIVSYTALQQETCPTAERGSSDGNEITDSQPFLVGVIGATISSVSVPVASLFRQFMVPQISYASTSPLLSDRDRYGFFLRTVPADDAQAMAMYQLALRFNWTLVAAIHSNDAYGEYGIEEFRRLSKQNVNTVCIDFDEGMDASFTDMQHQKLAERLVNDSRANAVILFASTTSADRFLQALNNTGTQRKFVWIVSDAIAPSPKLRNKFGNLLVGMFGFHHLSEPFLPFESFFANVTLGKNQRNRIWYEEYCKKLIGMEGCQPNTSAALSPSYVQDASSTYLVNSVYSIAHGLDRFLKENCARPLVWYRSNQTCQGQNRTLTRALLLEYIQNSNFISPTGFHVMYDSKGNSEGLYGVYNLHINSSHGYNLHTVGIYNSSSDDLQLNTSDLQFGTTNQGKILTSSPSSQCTVCDPGFILIPVHSTCCGRCQPCLGNSSTNGPFTSPRCFPCGLHQWGNSPLNGSNSCIQLDATFIKHNDVWGAFIILLSIIGLFLVAAIIVLVGIFWNAPVIKSFGREQMVILLIGLIFCFILSWFYIIRPSLGICLVQRLGLWFCFSLVFGALLVKLIRITRIFLRKMNGRLRFIEPQYQIIFTLFIAAGQMILAVISLIVVHPTTTTDVRSNPDDSNNFPTLILTCQSPHLAPLILLVLYDTILIILNNVLAIFTIRFPENFNEARHVSFSTFAIGVVWLGFIPSYFATQIEYRAGVVGFAVLMSAFAVLLCLFVPRVIVAIQQQQKKSNTQTNKSESTFTGSETGQTTLATEHNTTSDD